MPGTVTDSSGAEIVATLESTFLKYLALDAGLALVLALWTLATHVFDCFDAFPYLAINSPTKRCGKTRSGEIIEVLACEPLLTTGASPAAIFRKVQAQELKQRTVTLIMDESETLRAKSERSELLLSILNSGYRRGQSVLRCEGEKHEPKAFKTFCPKVVILIGTLPDTLADRCIPITMRRRRAGEHVERFFYARARHEAADTLGKIETWAKAARSDVEQSLLRDLEFLEDREAELWLPLFAVCQVAARERIEELQRVAIRISKSKQAEEPADMGVLLIKDIREVFLRCGESRLATSRLLVELTINEESPWNGWSNGKGLSARDLARLVRPFGIESRNLRTEGQILKGYDRVSYEEAWATYLPLDPAATPLQSNAGAGSSDFSIRYTGENVADRKHEIINKNHGCSRVALPEAQEGIEEEL